MSLQWGSKNLMVWILDHNPSTLTFEIETQWSEYQVFALKPDQNQTIKLKTLSTVSSFEMIATIHFRVPKQPDFSGIQISLKCLHSVSTIRATFVIKFVAKTF